MTGLAPCPPALVALASRLVDASGAVIRPWFRKALTIEDKADASPVTVADRGAEEVIRRMIEAERPEDGIIGEEFGRVREDAEFVWVIDPIDGTKQFITGRPLFGTLIGLMHRGRFVLGVIDQPILNERWIGGDGHPTTLNGQPISVRRCPQLSQAIITATSPDMFMGAAAKPFARVAKGAKHTLYGNDCYGYGLLALGFFDVVIEADLKIYDYAAVVPVIEAAGGLVTNWQGEPAGPDSGDQILAAGDPACHAEALALLQP